ncbi:MAG: NUDIX hydrolase [Bacteroidales bacterium]|nr:NUDIX hydrolase [Bacteroidales bacterium]
MIKYTLLYREFLCSTPRFDVLHDDVEIDDIGQRDFYYLKKPGSVSVIPYTRDAIGLISLNRYLTGELAYELPGGRIDAGEEPLAAAQRELLEETGLASAKWHALTEVFPAPSLTDEKVYLFAAEVENQIPANGVDHNEGILGFHFTPMHDILHLITTHRINCSIDGFALFFFLEWKRKNQG